MDGYGNSGYWCWIKLDEINPTKHDLLNIFVCFLYLWCGLVYNSVLIFLVFRHVRIPENAALLSRYDRHLKKIIWFPVAMLACWMMPSVYRIFQMVGYESFWVSWMHHICSAINGLVNTLIYALNKSVKMEIKKSFTNSPNKGNFMRNI